MAFCWWVTDDMRIYGAKIPHKKPGWSPIRELTTPADA